MSSRQQKRAVSSGQSQAVEGSPSSVATATGKRQRVSRACDQCRVAREKCDGVQPVCFPCVAQNRRCTYQVSPKKRGVQTGYIRTLELALAWTFDQFPGCEDALASHLGRREGLGAAMLSGKDGHTTSRLQKKWRRSRVHSVIEGVLSGDHNAAPHHMPPDKSAQSEDEEGSESDADKRSDPSVSAAYHRGGGHTHDSVVFSPTPPDDLSSPHIPQKWASTASRGSSDAQRTAVAAGPPPRPHTKRYLQLPPNHWHLLDVYFSYTHCWLPFLERREIYRTLYLYPPVGALELDPDSPALAVHAELWSALALASFQEAASSRPAGPGVQPHNPHNPHNSHNSHSPHNPSGMRLSPAQIYDVARQLIPSEGGPFRVQHVRALLLLSLVHLGREDLRPAWVLVGLAIRIFLLDVCGPEPAELSRDQRSVYMVCFMLDTLLSERVGHPPYLDVLHLEHVEPLSEDDLDEWQPWTPCEGFSQNTAALSGSRSPAYCISVFNQLYALFKLVSGDLQARRHHQEKHASGRTASAATAPPSLHQIIGPRAPFAAFVLSSEPSSSPPIPSPYFVRLLFLWAGTVLGDITEPGVLLSAMDVVEQYMERFGLCATPPFFAACLSSCASHCGTHTLSESDQTRSISLRQHLVRIWTSTDGSESHSSSSSLLPSHSHLSHHSSQPQRPHEPQARGVSPMPGSTPTSLYHDPSVLSTRRQQGPHPTTRDFVGVDPNVSPMVYRTGALLSPATTVHTTAYRTANNPFDPPIRISVPGQSESQTFPSRSAPVTGPTVDYDSLLDDLSSIDYIDRVHGDPDFMANLGFAPGCQDLAEIMSQDFGTAL